MTEHVEQQKMLLVLYRDDEITNTSQIMYTLVNDEITNTSQNMYTIVHAPRHAGSEAIK